MGDTKEDFENNASNDTSFLIMPDRFKDRKGVRGSRGIGRSGPPGRVNEGLWKKRFRQNQANANNDPIETVESENSSEKGSETYIPISRNVAKNIQEKIRFLGGPTTNLDPVDFSEKKFSGGNRLYLGNIASNVTEEDLCTLLKPYGETDQIFIDQKKHFAFVTMDFYANAVKVKNDLDGKTLKERTLKINLSPNHAIIKVKNLNPMVTNELLYYAFAPFGEIEEAKVSVNYHGNPTGEGTVRFFRKRSALNAIQTCNENCYFLTASIQPVIAEMVEGLNHDNEGFSDKSISKRDYEQYVNEREKGPRLAEPESFEFVFGQRWKILLEFYAKKKIAIQNELEFEKQKLLAAMEFAKYEHETEMLKNTLKAREMEGRRHKQECERVQRQAEKQQARFSENFHRYEQQKQREQQQWKQQDDSLFAQASKLKNLLDQTDLDFSPPGRSANSYVDRQENKNIGINQRLKRHRLENFDPEEADPKKYRY